MLSNLTTPVVWPPNSPDLNQMDCFVWGAAERDTNKTPCNTTDELVKRIRAVFKRFSKEVMVQVPRPY